MAITPSPDDIAAQRIVLGQIEQAPVVQNRFESGVTVGKPQILAPVTDDSQLRVAKRVLALLGATDQELLQTTALIERAWGTRKADCEGIELAQGRVEVTFLHPGTPQGEFTIQVAPEYLKEIQNSLEGRSK